MGSTPEEEVKSFLLASPRFERTFFNTIWWFYDQLHHQKFSLLCRPWLMLWPNMCAILMMQLGTKCVSHPCCAVWKRRLQNAKKWVAFTSSKVWVGEKLRWVWLRLIGERARFSWKMRKKRQKLGFNGSFQIITSNMLGLIVPRVRNWTSSGMKRTTIPPFFIVFLGTQSVGMNRVDGPGASSDFEEAGHGITWQWWLCSWWKSVKLRCFQAGKISKFESKDTTRASFWSVPGSINPGATWFFIFFFLILVSSGCLDIFSTTTVVKLLDLFRQLVESQLCEVVISTSFLLGWVQIQLQIFQVSLADVAIFKLLKDRNTLGLSGQFWPPIFRQSAGSIWQISQAKHVIVGFLEIFKSSGLWFLTNQGLTAFEWSHDMIFSSYKYS